MSFTNNTPPIDVVGAFTVRAPFQVIQGENYHCQSIRGFQEIEVIGDDVYESFYAPHSIPRSRYELDAKNNINIVTLLSDNDSPIFIPSSYILSFPKTTFVPYSRTFLTVDLGLLPDDVVLDDIKNYLAQRAALLSGMNPADKSMPMSSTGLLQPGEIDKFVKVSKVSVEGGVSHPQHEVSKNFRAARIRDAALISPHRQVQLLQEELAERDIALASQRTLMSEWEPIVLAARS